MPIYIPNVNIKYIAGGFMQELLTTKVNSPSVFKRDLLLIGSCLNIDHPKLIRKVSENRVVLFTCLEKHQMNIIETKLTTMIRVSKINDLRILTVDGSPHCWQLHVISESLKKLFGAALKVTNFVIERGEIHKINQKAIKTARHLHQVQRLIES